LREQAIEKVRAEQPIEDERLWTALRIAFGVERATGGTTTTEEQKVKPKRT
jgi:hypothetical protein